ncbi:uncharacterized protein H6S33_007554 [Morchella sextelata]|uniref:uncharacterized protein n=1 Tax=Morchella sextelata TaxID=1174677 RepID=UPI001D03B2CE|nr:uncharacterized protein H6S33_007554 [Morchella sextelata]KAH0603895.1 hypothetical protein H6S33_007554 [Morchella sextelata]
MSSSTSSSPPALCEGVKRSTNLRSKAKRSNKRKAGATKVEKKHSSVGLLKANLTGKSRNKVLGSTKKSHGNARVTKKRASKVKENQNSISLLLLPDAQDAAIFEAINYVDNADPAPVDLMLEIESTETIYPTSIVTYTEQDQIILELAAKVACARIANTPVFRNSSSPASRSSPKSSRKVLSRRKEPKHASPKPKVATTKNAKKVSPKTKNTTRRASLKAKATAARIIEFAMVKFSNSFATKVLPTEDSETLINNNNTSAMSEMMGKLTLKSALLRSQLSKGLRTWFSPLKNLPSTPLEEIL